MRQRILKKLIADTKNTSIYRMAKRLDINYTSLWRIVNGKSPGNIRSWDKIFAYYGRNYLKK